MGVPARKRSRSTQLSPILREAKPSKKTKFRVKVVEGVAIMRGENGALAVVPEDEVCRLAERLNLVIEGYQC